MQDNLALYDALSVTIRSDKVPSLPLLKVDYEQTFANKAEGDTIGGDNKIKKMVRGRYSGKISLEFYKDDWNFFRSQYEANSSIFKKIDGIPIFITYRNPDTNKVKLIETLSVGFKSEKLEGLDREGGKALTVKVEGIILSPIKYEE